MKRHFFIFLLLLFSYFISNAQSSDNPCNMRWTNVVTPLSTSLGNLMYQVQYPQNCGCGWPQVALGHTFPFPVKLDITLRGIKCDGTTGESGFSTGGNEVAGGYIHKENNQGNWHVFKQVIKTVAAEVRYTQNGDTYRFYYDENKGINTVQETINGLTVAEYNARKEQQNSQNTVSNLNNNSSGNSSQNGSSYHTAMNANDPRGNTGNSASQQEVQRQEQLNILNQKLNYQAQKYNNVADAVKSMANLLIGSMTQHFINEDIKDRNERFAELQNKVNTKPGTLIDCSECNGEGYFKCTQCNGNGYTGDGNDRTVCSKCYGLGKTQCVHCRGTGKEFKEDYEAEYGRKSSSDNSNSDNTQQINSQPHSNTSNDEDDPSSSNFSGAGAYEPSEIPKYAAQFGSKGQYRAAFNLYHTVTKGGYSVQQEQEADNVIASYYEQGKYVAANTDSARKYYAKAASLHPPSIIPSKIIAGASQTASGLYYIIEKPGYGSKPVTGQKVTIQYTETLIDGTKIGSSYDNHQPFQFDLGQVIKGLSEGVTLMNIGSKARLIVPSSLGYGSTSIGNIPANSVLIFEIELLNAQ